MKRNTLPEYSTTLPKQRIAKHLRSNPGEGCPLLSPCAAYIKIPALEIQQEDRKTYKSRNLAAIEKSREITAEEDKISEDRQGSLALAAEERRVWKEPPKYKHRMRDRSQAILLSDNDCTVCKSECTINSRYILDSVKLLVA
jgi:hypothetical protein